MADTVTIVLPASGLLPVACHAGEPVASVRGAGSMVGSEVPGVLCRIAHKPVDMMRDPRSVALFCCNQNGTSDGKHGFRRCPLWTYDKDLIDAGFKSMGDERVMHEENDATLREDLTGSRYGDISWMDALGEGAREALLSMQRSRDGIVRAEGGGE